MMGTRLAKALAPTALAAVALAACGSTNSNNPVEGVAAVQQAPLVEGAGEDAPDGLDLRLSEGKKGAPAYDRATLAPARKLSGKEAEALLARANPLPEDGNDAQPFALRPASLPPPRTGQVIEARFPPEPSSLLPPAAGDDGRELTVLRFMPEGKVSLAPELTVTFSAPMVAVTGQDDAARNTPVNLTPTPPGRWRWIGTRTVVFEPTITGASTTMSRFPMATTYTVEVPAGTKATNGATLRTAARFTFETPAATLVDSYPSSAQPQRTDVPMFLLFDQKIDPPSVLAKLEVKASGRSFPVRLLSDAEIEAARDKQLAATVAEAKAGERAGRWLAFRTTQPLPADAKVEVVVGPGTPSLEGPNVTAHAQVHGFRTYPPLRVERAECGHQNRGCRPDTAFSIRFNNPIDDDKFEETMITVTPEVPGLRVFQSHSSVLLQGAVKAQTTYKVTISSRVPDVFGQTLGKESVHPWHVGDARPTFFGPSGMVVLDPLAARPTLDFFSTNHGQLKVKLYKVTPGDYDTYGSYVQNLWNKDRPPTPAGTLVFDQLVKTAEGRNELVETHIDLSPALASSGLGHAVAIVEPHPWTEAWDPPRLISWVQSTKIAVDAHVDNDSLVAFASDLATGTPIADVELELAPMGLRAKTDAQGLATIPLSTARAPGAHRLIARRGDDVAFVTEHDGFWHGSGNWVRRSSSKDLAWYVIDDRKMYRPGEEVALKGWLRTIDHGKHGDVGPMPALSTVQFKVYDAEGNEIAKGQTALNPVGGFDTRFTLPKTPNLGDARVELVAQGEDAGKFDGTQHTHSFQVEEFRRPEFEVSAAASQGPFLVGQGGDVSVKAKYFSGGPLPGAEVQWRVTASRTSFSPPNRDDYIFGAWEPWWARPYDLGEGVGRFRRGGRFQPEQTWTLSSLTDATGEHVAHLDFLSVKPALPMSVAAHASVTDVNRQTWTASAALLVHPAAHYVGLRPKRPFVEKGQPFLLDVVGVDLDGKAAPGAQIHVQATRLRYESRKGSVRQKEVEPQSCTLIAAEDPGQCRFATQEGGTYKVTATIVDPLGRTNQTTMTFWVTGGDQLPARDVSQEKVTIIPDRKEYAAGETAELLVQAPFFPAEGIVTWRRSGILKTERITLPGPTKVIQVPVAEAMTPNLFVQVDLVGAAPRLDDSGDPDPKLPKRPAYAVGTIELPIPPKQRTLAVKVQPASSKVAPGESTRLEVTVLDALGRPVADAEAAVLVVDEAVLALTGHQFQDPIEVFYGARDADTTDHYLRAHVKLARPESASLDQTANADGLSRGGAGPGGGGRTVSSEAMDGALPAPSPAAPAPVMMRSAAPASMQKEAESAPAQAQAAPAIAIRSNFNPLAAFSPAVKTDARGRAVVDVTVPDNLTRYRVVAIATAGARQFGKGEDALTARLPLMVRPSPPRFLNFGDTFELPVVVQNQTDAPMTVRVAVRTRNAALTDGAGREVTVPANDRVEVRFPAAAEMAGRARFQIVGAAGRATDAAELALPVWTPATTEAFATTGVIEEGALQQPIALPGDVIRQFGGVEVTAASTNLQALTDAVIYLVKYPYECAEQRSSRILAIAALRDVLQAFQSKDVPSTAELEASVASDIERLSQMQNTDGGFSFWERGRPSEPFVSIHVMNALARASNKGFSVPAHVLENGKRYLREIERHLPSWYGKDIREAVASYALYTRKVLGELDVAKAKQLYAGAGGAAQLSMEANGWLLATLAGNGAAQTERQAIVRHALNRVSETAGAANFTTSYGDGAYVLLASDRRVDAVMLEALILEQPKLDLIPKLVSGLLAHRKAGRWLNTQENTFALVAMDTYFQTYEKTAPDFVARVWLGNDFAGERAFRGHATDRFAVPLSMQDVAAHDKQDLTIQKEGKGRLYYRIGMTYAPASLEVKAADFGFVVERRYEGVDDPKDVVRQADGSWKFKAGARVRVTLSLVNDNRRYHVALVDPLPAGLEPLNPALAVTGPIPTDPNEQQTRNRYWWWYGPWYDHQNMRDERMEAFATLLWEGVHSYSYVARATTPGIFVVPPPKAEEMYMPETFGRGASDRVIIE